MTHQVEGEKIGKLKTRSEQAKKSETNKVGQRNKLWLIKTTNNNEGGDKHGVIYQDNNTDNEIHTDNDNVRQRNKWWLIKTTNKEEGGEYGVDYQDDNDNTEPVCSSDKHGSVGLAIGPPPFGLPPIGLPPIGLPLIGLPPFGLRGHLD